MKRTWWKEAVVYQIYPRSFMDSNGDGIGDLRGIISRLDYLRDLGIDVIWLSPIYESPNDDNGYDISDYRKIMNEFGTMADFEDMLSEIHARDMKLVMDLVVNHTSDEHPWFVESRKSRDNPYRNYYIWRPGKPNGREPNNWLSYFSGSAWQFDEATGEYYLHLFTQKQADLNWAYSPVRESVYDMMKWWLDKGIDGFRMDVINAIVKAEGLPDAKTEDERGYGWGGDYFLNQPRVHDYLREMHEKVLRHYDMMTVGETSFVTTKDARLFAGEDRNELNMVFQFEHMDMDSVNGDKWTPKPWVLADLKTIMSRWQYELQGVAWGSLYLTNHDQPRAVSRFGDDVHYRKESAKMLVTFLHMMQGTPYVYQGEEIGMTNVAFDTIEDYRDVEIQNLWRDRVLSGRYSRDEVWRAIQVKARDNARTPMQWDDSQNAGFTNGTPWIKVNPNYREINVAQAIADPNSIYHYYKKIIQLRKHHPIMVYGKYDLILRDDNEIYAYTRTLGEEVWLVVCNFSTNQPLFELRGEIDRNHGKLVISNYNDVEAEGPIASFPLRPYECRVYAL